MSRDYFSESAKKLARANGINVSDIYTHRDDGLATVDNVKFAILKRHKEGFIVDPGDDGNYPIYVKNGKITSINVDVPNGGEAKLVIGRVIASRVVPLNNANSFGKNFGTGMMGNPIPFKKR